MPAKSSRYIKPGDHECLVRVISLDVAIPDVTHYVSESHTRNSPWCFGVLKYMYSRLFLNDLTEMHYLGANSDQTVADMNICSTCSFQGAAVCLNPG